MTKDEGMQKRETALFIIRHPSFIIAAPAHPR
jgi:hypothetical protein